MRVLFDIGGTKTRFATSEDGLELENIKIVNTSDDFESEIIEFKKYTSSLNVSELESITGGIAGPLSRDKSMVINAPNLPGWNNKPIKETLQKEFNVPISIENDAALVGLGEADRGAGKGKKIVVFFTISTGVGGARIINGKVDESFMGFEPGHQYIPQKESNDLIHLEGLISGTALKKKYNIDPEEIKDDKVWDECSYYLALGIHNSILFWSPEIIILGGSIMNKIDIGKVIENLENMMKIFKVIPEIKKAELGDKAGLYGALKLSKN
jgi:predicted NBD/HSP70 family sugar kinase